MRRYISVLHKYVTRNITYANKVRVTLPDLNLCKLGLSGPATSMIQKNYGCSRTRESQWRAGFPKDGRPSVTQMCCPVGPVHLSRAAWQSQQRGDGEPAEQWGREGSQEASVQTRTWGAGGSGSRRDRNDHSWSSKIPTCTEHTFKGPH